MAFSCGCRGDVHGVERNLRVEFRDRVVELNPGQFVVVPRGVEHRTAADEEAEVIIFEPADVVNTGDAEASEFTAPMNVKV